MSESNKPYIPDELPELGTKAAAVAGIESLLHAAIRLREPFSPLQLRYWLDAYYQARRAQEIEEAEQAAERKREETLAALIKSGPMKASAPTEEAKLAPQNQKVIKITAEDLEEARPVMEILNDEIRRAAKAAGIEIEDEAGPMKASPPTEERIAAAPAEPRNDRTEADGADVHPQGTQSAPPEQAHVEDGQKAAAETQQTAEGATSSVTDEAVTPSPQGEGKPRQRPVGWTDGFEPVELKKGPAAEAAKFKREQFERLQKFLREGVTMQRIVKAAEGNINEDQILGIRECKRVPVAVYRVLEAALDRIETE